MPVAPSREWQISAEGADLPPGHRRLGVRAIALPNRRFPRDTSPKMRHHCASQARTEVPRIMPTRSLTRSRLLITAAAFLSLTTPALADAIDGDWCKGADHMMIEGTKITTPGRNTTTGDYGRYRFSYVIPPNEPGGGGEAKLVMLRGGLETVHAFRPGTPVDTPEVWRRCKPVS
jgi:hypothetical protein